MGGLILASEWTWAIIVAFSLRMARVRRRSDAYEADFWAARDFDAYQAERGTGDVPVAKVGAGAPFVGVFGTVWRIMQSFYQIGQQQNSSLAVVAPGISEALFATA